MPVKPVVRYMLLCDDWGTDPSNSRRFNVFGLLSNIVPLDDPPLYPLLYREMCVFLLLTEGYGAGDIQIVCIHEETGDRIFETQPRRITFGADPLEIRAYGFRIRGCVFPQAGMHSVELWYDGELIEERPLRVR